MKKKEINVMTAKTDEGCNKDETYNQDDDDENDDDDEEDDDEIGTVKKKKTSTKISTERKDWTKNLHLWIWESNLFHKEFPKSQHASFFKLRIKKLATHIYNYLHRSNYFHYFFQNVYNEDDHAHFQVIDPSLLAEGTLLPSEQMIDPASSENHWSKKVFFPLEGIMTTNHYNLANFVVSLKS
jgi:hypothetical protein